MTRNIKYKPVTADLERMVKPNNNLQIRPSIGLEKSVGEFFYLSVEDLIPFRNQARILFDDDEILLLAESIKQQGIRQPLTVFLSGDKYEVVSGERRLRAAKIAGLTKVPSIIIKDSSQAEAIALIENIHRKDLNPVELGITYKNLIEQGVFSSQAELTEKISVNKSQVSEYIRYANFDPEIQKFIIENKVVARARLREAVKAYELDDVEKVKKVIGMGVAQKRSFLVFRVAFTGEQLKFQEQGVKKLSNSQKAQLKDYLMKTIETL